METSHQPRHLHPKGSIHLWMLTLTLSLFARASLTIQYQDSYIRVCLSYILDVYVSVALY